MTEKEQLAKLQARARRLGEELRALTEYIDEHQAWQAEQLDRWANEMSNLLTFLLNLEAYLELNNGMDGTDHGPGRVG